MEKVYCEECKFFKVYLMGIFGIETCSKVIITNRYTRERRGLSHKLENIHGECKYFEQKLTIWQGLRNLLTLAKVLYNKV